MPWPSRHAFPSDREAQNRSRDHEAWLIRLCAPPDAEGGGVKRQAHHRGILNMCFLCPFKYMCTRRDTRL